jgi:uncharacterized protein (DUF58 family)
LAEKSVGLLASSLVKLNNLQLVGKLLSDELILGLHGSKRAGLGVEFEQYRHYQPGDDLKRIDWKLYARSNKHLVRESAAESNTRIRFVIDLSGSMNYAENGVSRLAYARILLASLARLGYIQNDIMGLYALTDGQLHTLAEMSRTASAKQTFQSILVGLEKSEANGAQGFDLDSSQWHTLFNQKGKEQLILVTDLIQQSDEWIELIQSLANPHRELVVFQILGEQELNFNLSGFYRFKDLETGNEIELDAESARNHYMDHFQSYLHRLESALNIPQVKLIRVSLQDNPGVVLSSFLRNRKI